jgi:hypothetical protein|tara:strand:- start:565 stop:816 length:252 start_codon:yes stop_codon:yes gene_type:complete
MAEQQQQMNMNVDVKNTTIIETPDGGVVFQQGVLLRKVSKFVVGADEDALMPIPVFYDPTTGKILESTVPAEIREEYKDYTIA